MSTCELANIAFVLASQLDSHCFYSVKSACADENLLAFKDAFRNIFLTIDEYSDHIPNTLAPLEHRLNSIDAEVGTSEGTEFLRLKGIDHNSEAALPPSLRQLRHSALRATPIRARRS